MPTIFIDHGFRFFFYSNEGQEPIHVHIERGDAIGKWWILPTTRMASAVGLSPKEQKTINGIIQRRKSEIIDAWNKHFGH